METQTSAGVRALVAILQRVAAELPAAEPYVMVHHPAFRVGKKPFAIAGMVQGKLGVTLSINLGREAQHELLDDARFTKTPYIGQHGWVTIAHKDLKPGELEALVRESWQRVANRTQRAQLGAAPTTAAKAKEKQAKKR